MVLVRFLVILLQFSVSYADAIERPALETYMLGNYRYLVEAQVNCDGSFEEGSYICDKDQPGHRRILGTWDSHIIPVFSDKTFPVRYLDSNMFVTAHTLFPFFFLSFDDPVKELERQAVIHKAMTAINLFQRGESFAFWPQIGPSRQGQVNRIGPLNLSPMILGSQLNIALKVENILNFNLLPQEARWVEKHLDLEHPEIGFDALFNVPNDSDDTAMGIVSNHYYYRDKSDKSGFEPFEKMNDVFSQVTDTHQKRKNRRFKSYLSECPSPQEKINLEAGSVSLFQDEDFLEKCSLDDPREAWRYSLPEKYSGAFMTWLNDETQDIYSDPSAGVALPGQNSIDCNVVANVLYSLSLTGKRNDPALRPGYEDSCNAISKIIVNDDGGLRVSASPRKIDRKKGEISTWKYCGLFYPAHMTFPYMISKAVSEGGACQDLEPKDQNQFDLAMRLLAKDIVTEQDQETSEKVKGQWWEEIDKTIALPTALGGVALLNLHKGLKGRLGIKPNEIKNRVELALTHVMGLAKSTFSEDGLELTSLPEGTFFGGGTVDEIAHWRSEAFATSISLELSIKYLNQFLSPSENSEVWNVAKSEAAALPEAPVSTLKLGPLPTAYSQDHLAPLEERQWQPHADINLRGQGDAMDLIVGVELSEGLHLSGSHQEATEEVAYYRVKVSGEYAFNINNSDDDEYRLEAKFMGIHTKTDFIVNDEIAFLPIRYVKERQVTRQSLHLLHGSISAPLFKLSESVRINVNLAADLVGYTHRSRSEGDFGGDHESINLGDFTIGFTVVAEKLSLETSYESGIGYSRDSKGSGGPSHKNYKISSRLKYAIDKNQSLSFLVERVFNEDDLFNEDTRFSTVYQYKWR